MTQAVFDLLAYERFNYWPSRNLGLGMVMHVGTMKKIHPFVANPPCITTHLW